MADLAPDEIYCPACGVVIHESTNFCPECGVQNDAYDAGGEQRRPDRREPAPREAPRESGPPPREPRSPGGGGVRQRLVDRDWDLQSRKQVIAGVRSGLYAAVVGVAATLQLTLLTMLSVITGGGPGGSGGPPQVDPGAVEPSRQTAVHATNLVLGAFEALQNPVGLVVKFVAWLYYSANFVPITVESGRQSIEVDLLANLAPLGASPALFRVATVGILVAFGYRAAASRGYESVGHSAGAGATVAVGYLLLLVPAAALVTFAPSLGSLSVGPGVGSTVVFGGGLAAVFGAAGGALREYNRRRP